MFKLKLIYSIGVISFITYVPSLSALPEEDPGLIVKKDVKHDTSLPWQSITTQRLMTERPKFSSIQEAVKAVLIPLKAFQGLGIGFGNYVPSNSEPETNMAIGLNQVFQFTSPDVAIFDKATMTILPGFPKSGASIWTGFGGSCETHSGGRMTVKYDQLANRWFLSQFAMDDVQTGPFYHCIAVSTSADAAGSYHRYAFQLNSFSPFARLSLWPDAYYGSFYMQGRNASGPLICAFEREKMLNGQPSMMQCKQLSALESGPVLPANLAGQALPTGQPEYFLGLQPPNNLKLYKFKVNFMNPNNTMITSLNIPVESYTEACFPTRGSNCVIQPNTANVLDVVSDRLKTRLVYRQFENYGSLVGTHVIEGPQPKYTPGIRWYELRVDKNSPTFNPYIYQQGTIAHDSKNRFMPSITMDKLGSVAVGYTVTSSLIYPSLEMGWRHVRDPLNTMTVQPLITGKGSQTGGISQWGTTSKMVIDPEDNCTFWFTSQYLKTTGVFNWSTAILKFKLPEC